MHELIYPDYENFDKYKNLKYNVKYRIKKSMFKKEIGKQCEIFLHVPDLDSIEKIKMYIYDVYHNHLEPSFPGSLIRLHPNPNDEVFSFKNEKELLDLLNAYEIELELDKEYAKEKINEIAELYEIENI